MISIISATNRPDSKTAKVAKSVFESLQQGKEEVRFCSLEKLDGLSIRNLMYAAEHQDPKIAAMQNEFLIPAGKFVFVVPEYNGSMPGILKFFLDACSVRAYTDSFSGKKACLIGVASGRAGNLRGIDHLRGVLSHVGTNVIPGILPLSNIESLLDEAGNLNTDTVTAIEQYLDGFVEF